jgi:CheY-like chemotaxis protein
VSLGSPSDPHVRELPRRPESYARILVRDSGCGMGETTRIRIFEPFFTTKPAGKGTGLGLAVVHGIVEGCGGHIVVESESGRGASFTLWLPLAHETAVSAPAKKVDATRSENGEHILYVDDDEAINFLVQRVLSQLGYKVTCSHDPAEALQLFSARPLDFDVVVTDLSMPGMNGFDLVRSLKAVRANLPVIVTSGYVRDHDQVRATELKVDHIILKPNTVDELGQALDKLCKTLRKQN